MRKISLSVSVPHPCQQPWEKMAPNSAGRYCSNCNKTVVDFSQLSDNQIISILADTSKSHCGRFKASQLERVLIQNKKSPAFIPAAMLGTALAASFAAEGASAMPREPHPMETQVADHAPAIATNEIADTAVVITGKITDMQGVPIPFVSVRIKKSRVGVIADPEGNYRLTVPDKLGKKPLKLIFSFIGYKTKEVLPEGKNRLDIQLQDDPKLLDEDAVIAGGVVAVRLGSWQKAKYAWSRLWSHG
ncbi:carboxypeptidase-like regulatory domain-containing protein [Chitinophaga flava]|nr:carboxypeptidase-like regulatory domain-containing protein [Chitinophaga flava]